MGIDHSKPLDVQCFDAIGTVSFEEMSWSKSKQAAGASDVLARLASFSFESKRWPGSKYTIGIPLSGCDWDRFRIMR